MFFFIQTHSSRRWTSKVAEGKSYRPLM